MSRDRKKRRTPAVSGGHKRNPSEIPKGSFLLHHPQHEEVYPPQLPYVHPAQHPHDLFDLRLFHFFPPCHFVAFSGISSYILTNFYILCAVFYLRCYNAVENVRSRRATSGPGLQPRSVSPAPRLRPYRSRPVRISKPNALWSSRRMTFYRRIYPGSPRK